MCVCVYCNTSSPIQSWLCVNCVSDILPFNHIIDDEEFQLIIFQYFHLSKQINISKLQSLKINPFNTYSLNANTIENDDTRCDSENDVNFYNSCQYMFNEDFTAKYSNMQSDFSLFHVNARSLQQNFDQFFNLLSSLEFKFSVMAISETSLTEKYSSLRQACSSSLRQACRELTASSRFQKCKLGN